VSFPPGDTAVIDSFNRADGAPSVGRPDIWGTTLFNGDPASCSIVSNQLKPASGDAGIVTVENESDFIRIIEIPTAGSGYFLLGWGLGNVGSSWRGYYAVFDGLSWSCSRRDAGGATVLSTFTSPSSLSNGQRVGIKRVGNLHEVYIGSSVNWGTETPVMSFTDSTYASGGFFFQFLNSSWAVDNWTAGELAAPTSGVTIYVDADHSAASDDGRTRIAASDPSTPFLTVNAACRVARAGATWHDTVLVRPSTLGKANPGGTDPNQYGQLDHRWTDRAASAVGWIQGDNAGNQTIVVQGDVADLTGADRWATWANVKAAALPRIYRPMWRGLTNWKFSRIRFGYQVSSDAARTAGTGHDFSTLGSFERSTDITFDQCHHTGGLGITAWWAGQFNIHQCVIHSPLPPDGGNPGFHDGAGFRTERLPNDSDGGASVGALNVTQTEFSNVRGDDALTVGGVFLGDPQYGTFDWVVDQCLFHNVTEGANPSFHTDAMQCLACPKATITRTVFAGCSTSFIASDGRNGVVTFSNNLVIAAGSPIQIQGTDRVIMEHNTFFHTTALRDATLLFFTRASIPSPTVFTFRNNIIGGIFMRDSTLAAYFHATSVFQDNIVLTNPGGSTPFGTHLPGIAEFGNSARLNVIPNDVFSGPGVTGTPDLTLARTWELANTPVTSPGIGQGVASSTTTDLFGRAYTNPPDIGCLQSSPGTLVTPVARAPYVVSRSPAEGATGVDPAASVTARLYPVPGKQIDAATVTTNSAYVRDPFPRTIPAVVTLSAPDTGGYQDVTIDLKASVSPLVDGTLGPAVVYEARLTTEIADTGGTHLEVPVAWTFRAQDPAGPVIYAAGAALGSASFRLEPDPRFPVGMTLRLWETTGDGQAKGRLVATATVGADQRATFTDLQPLTYYVAGPSLAGPFTYFRLY
jgi:hypothetical protein